MRIALITPGFSAASDDWCIPVLLNLAVGLAAHHDVTVFATSYPRRADEYLVRGVPVRSFGSARPGRLARYGEKYRLAAALRREHEQRPFDVLHGFWAHEGGLLSALLGGRLGVPSAMTIMAGELSYEASVDYGKSERLAGALGRFAARRVTRACTISRYQQARLKREEPWLDTTCQPFGVDLELFAEQGATKNFPDAVNVLVVGSLVPVKGHAIALHAIKRVVNAISGIHLHVIGEGILRDALSELAGDLGIERKVTFHGHVEHDRLPAYYRAADFCLLSSHFETSGMVVLEAAACGRLTVGSDVGSLPDIVPEGLRTAPGDATALADTIRALIEQPDKRRRLEREAVDRIHAGFTLEHMLERHTRLYESLADAGDPRS